jgi:hypothetical protein
MTKNLVMTQNIHDVVEIRSERVVFSTFVSHKYMFIGRDGSVVEVTAFVTGDVEVVDLGSRQAEKERAK